MKSVKAVFVGIVTCICAIRVANATDAMKPVALPPAEGTVVGAAFSPDNSRLAVIRHVTGAGSSGAGSSANQHVLQIVDLKSGRETSRAEILSGEPADLASTAHLAAYSSDGRYLLIATQGSDVLSIMNATSLHAVKQFALHPEPESRRSLAEGHRYFRGVVSLSVASKAGIFAVMTHDELQGNEVFVGSFASETITNNWSLGRGRSATQLGEISLSLSDDGSRVAVSVLPDGNSLPKNFQNLRLYDTGSGHEVKSIRTHGLIGPIVLLSGEDVAASRIDTPGLFSKKPCIEIWNFNTGALGRQFCDSGRTVSVALAVSHTAGRVVGFASQIRKSIEGQVYSASGRIDVWDMKSGDVVASSQEISRLVSHPQVSANGEWVLADQTLFQIGSAR